MEIPYYDKERPDTGLYNGKAGIWLFLASEVMLFGALFSAYVLLRVGAEPGTWSMGLMNQWVGAFNTLILIASSATIVMAWVCLKLNDWKGFRKWKWATVVFAFIFLIVKWSYEWPAKFTHYDVTFVSNESAAKVYTDVLGPKFDEKQSDVWQKRFDPLKKDKEQPSATQVKLKDKPLDGHIVGYIDSEGVKHKVGAAWGIPFWSHAFAWRHDRKNIEKEKDKSIRYDEDGRPVYKEGHFRDTFRDKDIKAIILVPAHGTWDTKEKHANSGTVKYAEAKHDGGHAHSDEHGHTVTIAREDISRLSSYEPAHSTFFATYYTLTGLHALHVLGGILVMLYHLLPVSRRVYEKNPVQFTNRIEITGLFWHFVDLVWIFLFPILYLM
ncbi:MAG: cytochrome c oxidase subunit 3 [Verrucomicrobiota bacterium]|nr:cytochrome c oxidase subunit 3 [Verrucomicrobiota bacterium]